MPAESVVPLSIESKPMHFPRRTRIIHASIRPSLNSISVPEDQKIIDTSIERKSVVVHKGSPSIHPRPPTPPVSSRKRTAESNATSTVTETNVQLDASKDYSPDQRGIVREHKDKTKSKRKRKRAYSFRHLWIIFCCLILLALLLAAVIMAALTAAQVFTTTSTTTKTTTTVTTATTTTTTPIICGATCVNDSISTSSLIAFYSFDSVITDSTRNYDLNGSTPWVFVPGWIGQAISFNATNAQGLSTKNMPLSAESFTIDFWFYSFNVSSGWDIPFMGQFTASTTSQALFISIYNNKLYFGFYGNDAFCATNLNTNTWYHAAFVHDNVTLQRFVYLNGIPDGWALGTSPLMSTVGSFTVGWARIGGRVVTTDSYYTGYIDQLTITRRARTACEVYLIANLACYLPFDSPSPMVDASANRLTVVNTGGTSTSGRVNQGFYFSSSLSFILISDISALKSPTTTFSISMWINPTNLNGGTLIHTSSQSNGQGNCLLMWGFTSTGYISVNVIDPNNNTISATSLSPLSTHTWTHIAQTFSSNNGSRLYIDGILTIVVSAPTGQPIGPFAYIGSSPSGTSICPGGLISRDQYYGHIDEFRVFRNELTAADVCRLANP